MQAAGVALQLNVTQTLAFDADQRPVWYKTDHVRSSNILCNAAEVRRSHLNRWDMREHISVNMLQARGRLAQSWCAGACGAA